MAPTIDVFVTSIFSTSAIRGRHERVARYLAELDYKTHDVAGNEQAKKFWKRKNGGNNELPCILVDGVRVGSIEELDEAVEFRELRQFLRLDSGAPPPAGSSPSPSTLLATSSPPPKATPTIDDFADLNLTPAELEALTAELSSTSGGFDSGEGHTRGTTQSYTFTPTEPLSFGRKKEEKVTVVKALPGEGPLGKAPRDEMEGIELTEDEANALARELGLDDGDEVAQVDLREPPSGASVSSFFSAKSFAMAEDDDAAIPTPIEEEKDVPPTPVAKDTPQATSILPPAPSAAEPEDPLAATSVDGSHGAALSAPIAELAQLHLSPSETSELLSSTPPPAILEVEPLSDFEKRVVADAAEASSKPDETTEQVVPPKGEQATVAEVQELKGVLNEGGAAGESRQVPVVEALEAKVVAAIRDGVL